MTQQRLALGVNNGPAGLAGMRCAVVAFLALMTAACASLGPDSPEAEKVKVVTERAAARWNAIIGKDFALAYEYMSPATRATVTAAGFKTVASRLDYRSVKITDVTCDGAACRVKLILTYTAGAAINSAVAPKGQDAVPIRGINTPLQENWVIEKGQAWYVWPL
jgi:hypothetical protein